MEYFLMRGGAISSDTIFGIVEFKQEDLTMKDMLILLKEKIEATDWKNKLFYHCFRNVRVQSESKSIICDLGFTTSEKGGFWSPDEIFYLKIKTPGKKLETLVFS